MLAECVQEITEITDVPHRCWSLRDMAEYFRRLYNLKDEIDDSARAFGRLSNPNQPLDDNAKQLLNQRAEQLAIFFGKGEFVCALRAARRLQEQRASLTPADVVKRLDDLWTDFLSDCDGRFIELIDPAKTKYYDKGFGHPVDQAFPEATKEIREAGKCFAVGRDTACVFHLMRAVEHGVRALAIAGGVTAMGPLVPLDYATWDELSCKIKAIVGDDKAVAGWSKPAKASFRAFFSGSLSDFNAFRDECRNLLMHTRSGLYNEHEALNWITRVSQFMNRLAERVSEQSTTPLLEESRWL